MSVPGFEVVSDFDPCSLLESTSGQLGVRDTLHRLSLFEALPVSVAGDDAYLRDAVLFAGGLCNTLDWCPRSPVDDAGVEYLALSCHAKQATTCTVGTAVTGPGVVQIWAVEERLRQDKPAAQLVMGLVHDGALCFALQWCPTPQRLLPSTSGLGLLAMALGNGEVQIVAVPQPTASTVFVRVEPWVRFTQTSLGHHLVSCLDWHPVPPHDLILMGCWDGTVSIWALPHEARSTPQHILLHSIDSLALRQVVWLKPSATEKNPDPIFRDCFCAVGHSGHLTLWNRNRIFQPLLDWTLTRWWLMDMDVCGDPLVAYVALEDASIRQLPLEVSGFGDQLIQHVFHVYSGLNKGAIHAISCSQCNSLVAYGGEDGEIAVFTKENTGDTRYRKPHICAGAMKYDSETEILHITAASDYRKIGGVYIGGAKFSSQQPKAEDPETCRHCEFEHQTVHCLKFSPNGDQTTWLAAGCAQGCLRLIKITE